jgi:hypothetical protein
MPTLLALPDARRTPITRGEGRLGRSDYLVNWAVSGRRVYARPAPDALATRVIALSVVWSLTRSGGQARRTSGCVRCRQEGSHSAASRRL